MQAGCALCLGCQPGKRAVPSDVRRTEPPLAWLMRVLGGPGGHCSKTNATCRLVSHLARGTARAPCMHVAHGCRDGRLSQRLSRAWHLSFSTRPSRGRGGRHRRCCRAAYMSTVPCRAVDGGGGVCRSDGAAPVVVFGILGGGWW